jgi:hypothetical protein
MKKILLPALISGIVLLGLSFLILFLSIRLVPSLMEEYYNPMFQPGTDRAILFYAHPFVLSLALSWFWNRVKSSFSGGALVRGLEFGGVYALVATLPAMWITFSMLTITITMVASWVVYGLLQACIAGIIFARMNP